MASWSRFVLVEEIGDASSKLIAIFGLVKEHKVGDMTEVSLNISSNLSETRLKLFKVNSVIDPV
jgi:hypothetical protein